jgi:indolepyruvate ferredoxin oxidoreductase
MAYKDEYEVARLYADGRFAAWRAETFKGGRAKVLLAPPILAPRDAEGRPRKMAFGGWMLRWGFPALARLKGLRGTPFDVFGHSAERRAERALIAEYEADVARLLEDLTSGRLALAVQIASIPDQIRGFGHVKAASIKTAAAGRERLWDRWESAPKPLIPEKAAAQAEPVTSG